MIYPGWQATDTGIETMDRILPGDSINILLS